MIFADMSQLALRPQEACGRTSVLAEMQREEAVIQRRKKAQH